VPPLRERLDDLADICDALLARIAGEAKVEGTPQLANDAMSALRRYSFPGNVRELENLLHRAVALASTDVISANDLGLPDIALDDIDEQVEARMAQVRASAFDALAEADADLPSDLVAYLDDVERHVLERALDVHRNNRTAAGASLGLTLRQMRYRMARLGIGVAGADHNES
jgi:two-component system, NtrC family, response regulator PilR